MKNFKTLRALGKVSEAWLEPKNPFRKKAIQSLVKKSGFSHSMAGAMVDSIFQELTRKKLRPWLSSKPGLRLTTHVFSSNLPNPAIAGVVQGMMTQSINIAKVSSRDPGILEIYLESLKKQDPRLAQTNFLLDAKDRVSLKKWIKISDVVTAYGNDKTIADLKKMTTPRQIFNGHGHRVSFSLYLKETLNRKGLVSLARKTACDVWMADQRGCLSPTIIYVQKGGEVSPREFAEAAAKALENLNTEPLRIDAARRWVKERLKNRWKLKQAAGKDVFFRESARRGEWAVFYEGEPLDFPLSCGGQTIFISAFEDLREVYAKVHPYKKYLQAVALEAPPAKRKPIVRNLSAWGVGLVTAAGRLQYPPTFFPFAVLK